MMVMFVSLYTFGINVHGDVLENVEEIEAWESYVLRGVFMILMATHLPFIFFVGKDSLLAIIALLVVKGDIEKEIIKNIANDEDYGRQTKQAYVEQKQKKKDKKKKKNKKKDKKGHKEALIDDNSSEGRVSYQINRESTLSSVSSDHVTLEQPKITNYTGIVPTYEENNQEERSESIISYEDAEQNVSVGVDQLPKWVYYTVTLLSYGAVVAASSFITDAEIVLKFIGSVANALLNFTLPGLFYFVIMRRYNVVKKRWKIYLALALAIYGALMGIILTGVNIWTSISPVVRHPDDV
uniref:Amino acid transporter transmembrane domain-containing protein n=1 Tax=Euplotes crassus TaxID=5936 RepID=A0A7S3KD13_EUPCR|mmetsp:Transcript_18414/g.18073  ORF Transcript_18414/g.18073 Transcript_18414/m.18073 type:complete len:296 (+) Transcript_18414:46-933(+)|eukprot:CAMPEP_0197012296 /NCGR_PEP_ID=MMETSP1380-20130617/61978_1 /TAXON_ID=5936 /ORGANISM="Euplotes crassus, Strain CT5" /LENGTH=295 /DNA_ID=CAMNT_0042435667 /DNA_START=45 /DNA_END=932 /DNA_ORIENTATION=-